MQQGGVDEIHIGNMEAVIRKEGVQDHAPESTKEGHQ